MKYFCIADKDSSIGFRMAGIDTREVVTKNDAVAALKTAALTKETGVILVTEKISSLIREEINLFLQKNQLPLILELPSRGEVKKRKSVSEFLKETMGMSI
jgi:V/A-type H+-transporting ATPase subunit F